ncbi:hypothetical protein N0V92_002687 [Colletotrichum tropicale]|nr:hypothetical protein N0V92_002687 [Colletotrichum tropicale]
MCSTQNITWTACDFPLNDEVQATKTVRIVLFAVLPTLSVILRVITKFARLSPWGWDDYTILVSYIILLGYVSLHFYRKSTTGFHPLQIALMTSLVEYNGAGKDLWTLTDHQIMNFFKAFYALQVLYHSCIDLIKASILFMYLRIFHLPGEKVRIVLWATLILNILNGMIFILVGLFQCKPISLAWTFWTGEATGKCIDIVQLALAHAGINIALDVWMLIIPATQIWNMNLATRKKFAIMFMFGLGLFLTVVCCYRITQILEFKKYPLNPTVAMMPSVIWSDIELYVGIFTACIPNLRQFFVRFILGQSEKKKRLSSAISGSANSNMTPRSKRSTLSHNLSEFDDLDNLDADEMSSPQTPSKPPHV